MNAMIDKSTMCTGLDDRSVVVPGSGGVGSAVGEWANTLLVAGFFQSWASVLLPMRVLVVLGIAVCILLPAEAAELLPYNPPGANSPAQRSLGTRRPASPAQRSPDANQPRAPEPARVARDQRELSAYYRQKAEEAHRRGDTEAERFYLQRWSEIAGPRH